MTFLIGPMVPFYLSLRLWVIGGSTSKILRCNHITQYDPHDFGTYVGLTAYLCLLPLTFLSIIHTDFIPTRLKYYIYVLNMQVWPSAYKASYLLFLLIYLFRASWTNLHPISDIMTQFFLGKSIKISRVVLKLFYKSKNQHFSLKIKI